MIEEHPRIFGKICQLSESYKSVLFHWNRTERKMNLGLSVQKDRKFLLMRLAIHGIFAIILCAQGISAIATGRISNIPLEDLFIYGFSILCVGSQHFLIWSCFLHARDICSYINGLVAFHSKCKGSNTNNQPRTLLQLLSLGFCFCTISAVYSMPVAFSIGLHWINPCKISLMGYWLLPECYECRNSFQSTHHSITSTFGIIGIVAKTILMITNSWMWAFGLKTMVFTAAGLNVMCVASLQNCIKKFLLCSLLPDTPSFETAKQYRTIQVMALLMNKIQKGWQMNWIICACSLAEAICLTIIVKILPDAGENLVSLAAFCPMYPYAAAIMTIILGGMAKVYTCCEETFRLLRKDMANQRNKGGVTREERWKRRFYRSCPYIKVMFGSFNYVDGLTPLKCIDFANSLAINFLLMDKR